MSLDPARRRGPHAGGTSARTSAHPTARSSAAYPAARIAARRAARTAPVIPARGLLGSAAGFGPAIPSGPTATASGCSPGAVDCPPATPTASL